MDTEEIAVSQVEKQLRQRGFSTVRKARNCRDGDIHARNGHKHVRVEVKGLDLRNGVWLTQRQVNAVDIVVVYICKEDNVWVFSPAQARKLLDDYQADFIRRHGRPPAAEGFNASQFPQPTGWQALDPLL